MTTFVVTIALASGQPVKKKTVEYAKKNALRYVINTIANVVRGLTSFISRVLRHAENSGLWHNRLTRYTVPRGVALKRKRPKKR